MCQKKKYTNYEIVYEELRTRLRDVDFARVAKGLGLAPEGDGLKIPFFNREYILNHDGLADPSGEAPDLAQRIVACHYVLRAGGGLMSSEWAAYRDFKDAQFFMPAFRAGVEEKIANAFQGNPNKLSEKCVAIGGEKIESPVGADVCMKFFALPRIPVLLNFFDADEDFDADARVMFDKSAPRWLDMECLAVTGMILADLLTSGCGCSKSHLTDIL